MQKKRKVALPLTVLAIGLILALLGWFLSNIFEGEEPRIDVHPLPEFLSGAETFTLTLQDTKRGLRRLEIVVSQEGRERDVLKERFPFTGFLNRGGIHSYDTQFEVDPAELKLTQGRVDLEVRAWDYSRRRGGDGNLSIIQHKIIVDTTPPALRSISRLHYVNLGGTGLVVYQTSSDTVESGVHVEELFFPGFPAGEAMQAGGRVCYFAVPYDTRGKPEIYLWAKDKAGNEARNVFHARVRKKNFRHEKVNITEGFLSRILPYFDFYEFAPESTDLEKFLRVNQDLRKENTRAYFDMREETGSERLWEGTFLRLQNAATMATYGDQRSYYHKGEKVDEQVHLGVDLASLANSEVHAANHGRVIFAGRLGIYGNSVVLDHGQGVASVYGHMSHIGAKVGQEVTKGEMIGTTGQTGLAGGDHLHFAMMVGGVFVNPIEWWDPHWIQDNVTTKLALLDQ